VLFFKLALPHHSIPHRRIYLIVQSFAGKIQISTWIFEILNYIIYRVQIQIAHVSEIGLLLGDQALNFFFVYI